MQIEFFSWAKIPPPPDTTRGYVLIADEAHAAQNPSSKRSKAFLALADNAIAVWPMTGTPLKNGRPANLYPLLVAIKHPIARDRRTYEVRYCGAGPTAYSRWLTTGASHMDELYEKTHLQVLRRLKKQCLDLPKKTRVLRKIEITPQQHQEYTALLKALQEDYYRRLREGKIKEGGEALVELTQLRHAGSVAKAQTAIDMTEEINEAGGQVVIFVEFKDTAERIAQAVEAEILSGDTLTKERDPMVQRFQNGERKNLVCMFGAGGVGITLTAAQTVILVDRPWTPGDAVQAEDRLHRISQEQPVLSVWLQAFKVDEMIDKVLEAKEKRIDLVLEGKRKTMRLKDTEDIKEIAQQLLPFLLDKGNTVVEEGEDETDSIDTDESPSSDGADEEDPGGPE